MKKSIRERLCELQKSSTERRVKRRHDEVVLPTSALQSRIDEVGLLRHMSIQSKLSEVVALLGKNMQMRSCEKRSAHEIAQASDDTVVFSSDDDDLNGDDVLERAWHIAVGSSTDMPDVASTASVGQKTSGCAHVHRRTCARDGHVVCDSCGLVLNSVFVDTPWSNNPSGCLHRAPYKTPMWIRNAIQRQYMDNDTRRRVHMRSLVEHYAPYVAFPTSRTDEIVELAVRFATEASSMDVAVAASMLSVFVVYHHEKKDIETAMRSGVSLPVAIDDSEVPRFKCQRGDACGQFFFSAKEARLHQCGTTGLTILKRPSRSSA